MNKSMTITFWLSQNIPGVYFGRVVFFPFTPDTVRCSFWSKRLVAAVSGKLDAELVWGNAKISDK